MEKSKWCIWLYFLFPPVYFRLVDGYRKLHKFTNAIEYFSCTSWIFREENTKSLLSKMSESDQSNFRFDIEKLNWDTYIKNTVMGIRIYICQDPIETLPQGIKHQRKSVTPCDYDRNLELIIFFFFV